MKKILLFTCYMAVSTGSFCQEMAKPVSSIFVELAGNAGLLSVNYDRRFNNSNHGPGWRVGLGMGAMGGHGFNTATTFPFGLNYLLGKGDHHLEAGAGVTLGTQKFSAHGSSDATIYFIPSLGYRFQPSEKSVSFRLFVSPFLGKEVEPWAGLSLGMSF